jgi:UDP-glucose 4-epimerase
MVSSTLCGVRALVTGGAGFIGSNIVDRLVADGADVVVLDNLFTGFAEHVNPKADLRVADLSDADAVRSAAQACDWVFHQAAHRAVFRSVEDPVATNQANVGGTLNVLVAARDAGARRVVLASSSSVYGGADILPTPETAPLRPRSPYAVTKLALEEYARVFNDLYGLPTVALRYFNVYGPRQRPDSQYAAVIPLFIEAVATGATVTVHGDGTQFRSFTYIDDVVDANLLAAAAPAADVGGRVFNAAAEESSSLLDLIAALERVIGRSAVVEHTAPRAGDIKQSRASCRLARETFGFDPKVPFDDGLRRTVEWFSAR